MISHVIPSVGILSSLVAMIFAWYLYKNMMSSSEGTHKMKEIAGLVRKGAYTYLRVQYGVVFKVFMVLFFLFLVLSYFGVQNPFVPLAFLSGGFFSGLTGFIGMKTATNASARTANGCRSSLNRGLQIAFRSGAVMGLMVVALALLDICVWYLFLDNLVYTPGHMANGLSFLGFNIVTANTPLIHKGSEITAIMITFGMGASTQALFARVGGGIFTKAADVGADLIGKGEYDMEEDSINNPATIADNVGDNVGDVAGMGADLYESFCGSILATAALGAAISHSVLSSYGINPLMAILAPLLVASLGTLFSIVGIFLVKTEEGATQKDLLRSLLFGTLSSSVMIVLAVAGMAYMKWITWGIFGSVISGLVAGALIGQITEYFTSGDNKPVQEIAKQTLVGHATTVLRGFCVGMYSAAPTVIVIVVGILFSFGFSGGFDNLSMGLYGIGFAAVGMLSTLGITLATDAYGPIADNAGANAEMSSLGSDVRKTTDILDSLGNTTAATGKGYSIGSAALASLTLIAAFVEEVRIWIMKIATSAPDGVYKVGDKVFSAHGEIEGTINTQTVNILEFVNAYGLHILNPKLIAGIFIGSGMVLLFCAMTTSGVGKAASAMADEVRRQFQENPRIVEGKDKPDYDKCIKIATKGAQEQMILPACLGLAVPIVMGLLFGVAGVMGVNVGVLFTGFVVAVFLNNSGGAWDNAKKLIESGFLRDYSGNIVKKGSEAHKASITGDMIGDPFKDTSGPSINILIKLTAMVSIVFCGVIVKFGPIISELLGMG